MSKTLEQETLAESSCGRVILEAATHGARVAPAESRSVRQIDLSRNVKYLGLSRRALAKVQVIHLAEPQLCFTVRTGLRHAHAYAQGQNL